MLITVVLLPLIVLAQPGGAAWTNIGPRPAAIEAIVADPHGSGTIYMATIGGGVLKSSDGGMTWSPVNNGLTDLSMVHLAMDASGPQTVYTGNAGVFKTDDGGATWHNLPAITGAVVSLAADPNRPGVIYAGVYNNLANGAIRKSVDDGATWTSVFSSTAAIFKIAIDPLDSDIVYLPTIGDGAFKSTNGGQSWSPMPSLTSAVVWSIAIDPSDHNVLYAGTNEDGVWKSTDAGNTWQPTGSSAEYPVCSIAIDPSPAHAVYAGTNGGGVWTSSDDGDTWNSAGPKQGCALSEFRSHPPWRTALDACIAFKSPEDTLHLWRKPVEGAVTLIRSDHANLDGFFQQAAVRVAFHQNKAILLVR
jgi:photosystem II stability/assembly factor-like uncharacterized protein